MAGFVNVSHLLRGGKSQVAALEAVYEAKLKDYTDRRYVVFA